MEHLVALTARRAVIFTDPLELSMQKQLTAPLTYLTSTKPDRSDGVLLPTPCQPHPKTSLLHLIKANAPHMIAPKKNKKKLIYQQ